MTEHVDMVGRDRSPNDAHLSRLANLSNQIAGTLRHFPAQHPLPILRDPDQVVPDVPYRVPARAKDGNVIS